VSFLPNALFQHKKKRRVPHSVSGAPGTGRRRAGANCSGAEAARHNKLGDSLSSPALGRANLQDPFL